jgi:hypothetical protein
LGLGAARAAEVGVGDPLVWWTGAYGTFGAT